MARYKRKKKRKKWEFSKKLAVWAAVMATATAAASFVLAFMDKLNTVSDVTNTVFTACIGYMITYAGKSLGEKVSRNKHGLDENGQP